jgi:AraC-like DNA-binding protein
MPTTLAGCTAETAEDWLQAVLRSIGTMRENLGDEHSLRTLAQSAWFSPFHFHRVFHKVTDTTPARFLAAWRMAEAKQLLIYSSATVTDICMQIGYSSLGTFTSQFTRMVGVSPRRFRRLVTAYSTRPFNDILLSLGQRVPPPGRAQVTVSVTGGYGDGVGAAVGLFPSGIPQERPAACAVLPVPGTAVLGDLPDGTYYPLAMSFHPAVTATEAIATADLDRCVVGAADAPVRVVGGIAIPAGPVAIRLRARRPTDPPLVLALPLLMAADAAGVPAGTGD